ncbi:MAG TPA: D-2-hydroxyacid dehydrogenase [Chthonomonadaceae bacterium]|nr:D-2-hydroxyacid dehydrogenase [Chthonomonadaceae bacterium]
MPITVLIALDADDPDAQPFRDAVAANPELTGRVELRFGRGAALDAALPDADVVVCGNLSAEQIAAAPRLRWISFWSAGMDGKATPQLRDRGVRLTNASGVHGANIAEHVMCFMLMFTRRMETHFRSQLAGHWERGLPANKAGADELTGQTLGIVGLGRIGEALAVRAHAFGMRIIGAKRDPSVRHGNAPIDATFGYEGIPRLLAESDHVCIALPFTPETDRLFDAAMLAHFRASAYLYNIARGKIVDESALIDALREGRLAGAGLDVFDKEPLPPDSPLWTMPNVLITPHTAGITPHYFGRTAELFAANLLQFAAGEPLHNLYDPARGY